MSATVTAAVLPFVLLLGACAPLPHGRQPTAAYGAGTYTAAQSSEVVTIVSVRLVTIQAQQNLGAQAGSMAMGGALGGAAGHALAGKKSKTAGMVVGGVLGAAAGAAVSEAGSRQTAYEVAVRRKDGSELVIIQPADTIPAPNVGQSARMVGGYGQARIIPL